MRPQTTSEIGNTVAFGQGPTKYVLEPEELNSQWTREKWTRALSTASTQDERSALLAAKQAGVIVLVDNEGENAPTPGEVISEPPRQSNVEDKSTPNRLTKREWYRLFGDEADPQQRKRLLDAKRRGEVVIIPG